MEDLELEVTISFVCQHKRGCLLVPVYEECIRVIEKPVLEVDWWKPFFDCRIVRLNSVVPKDIPILSDYIVNLIGIPEKLERLSRIKIGLWIFYFGFGEREGSFPSEGEVLRVLLLNEFLETCQKFLSNLDYLY